MPKIRTATLEFLRHGPPHNQLLSPLTRYIAVCGNHPAETVEIPLEHGQLMAKLRGLSYREDQESREFQVKDMAQFMSGVLAQIPGLIAELVEQRQANELIHLRLIISASELALLPFEMSYAPNGFPGAGQHLMLQSQMPICITREVRRTSDTDFEWPSKPKILFAAASPPDGGEIPLESHLLALRKAIEPWIPYSDQDDKDQRQTEVQNFLVFLPNASLRTIERECSLHDFTHVHILAHGIPQTKAGDRTFGLALHDSLDDSKTQIVSGEELAAALRPFRAAPEEGLARPSVVTLASCDSGNVGSVVSGGASVAHSLHEADIPLVVASQFPLTFAGSVLMTKVLYEQLLWGGDPRKVIADLRRQLLAKSNENHDWASIVAYAALPVNLSRELERVEVIQSRNSIDAVLKEADEMFQEGLLEQDPTIAARLTPERRRRWILRMEPAKDRLMKFQERTMDDRHTGRNPEFTLTKVELSGLLGSTEKRQAQLLYPRDMAKAERDDTDYQKCRLALDRAMAYYQDGTRFDPSAHWVSVQYLSLACVLDHIQGDEKRMTDLWSLARITAENDSEVADRETVFWAYGSLIEIYLLAVSMTTILEAQGIPAPWKDAAEAAMSHARRLIQTAPRRSFYIASTRRQLLRYCHWYIMPASAQPQAVRNLAHEIVGILTREG